MDRGNKDAHRYTYGGGVKAVEMEKHGRDLARQRYGALKYENGAPQPKDQHAPQRLGDSNNLQGPGYDNDHAKDWVRGFGKGGVESAEGYSAFDKSKRR